MGLSDIFKAKQYKEESEQLKSEVEKLNAMLTPEMKNIEYLNSQISSLTQQKDQLDASIKEKNTALLNLDKEINYKRSQLLDIHDELLYQDFSLYKPKYDLMKSDDYKLRLDRIRAHQKEMIKNKRAVYGATSWAVNGNVSQGTKMVADMQKLLLRAFNSECDELIDKVTYSNIELSESRITKSAESISKLGRMMSIYIAPEYYQSKIEELRLVFEYRQAKQREKEEQKEIRAQMREEAKLQKEIEEARKKVEKEQKHYQNALVSIMSQLLKASDDEKSELEKKKAEIEAQLSEIDKNIKDIDYREANAKAGYVYIISNVGAFGENVYKIGMTRRLDPEERIDELSDASVPFDFDIHAMIFSDNAPKLEAALHKAFENRKLNMVNHRREFFAVTLQEIKDVVKNNYDKSVEFIDVAPAQQYRESLKIKQNTI